MSLRTLRLHPFSEGGLRRVLRKAVLQVLVFLFVALWFILQGDLSCFCFIVIVFFSPFSIAIASLGEERANLRAFCTLFCFFFDLPLFDFVCFLFLLVSGMGCDL